MPDEAPTIATALKSMGYATGQFGKNHLGDLNQFLPTVHGFDEFFGYLYHLDAMEDPRHRNYPPALKDTVGPRNMIHSWATDKDDPTVQPRWGKIGKQKIEDAGELYPEADGDSRRRDPRPRAQVHRQGQEGQTSRSSSGSTRPACTSSRISRRNTRSMRTPENGWSIQEAGMAQLDDIVGSVMKYLKDNGLEDNTIIVFSTDNGAENFTWPDGGQTPVRRRQGDGARRRLPRRRASSAGRARCRRARSRMASSRGSTGSRLSWPRPAIPNIVEELKKGKQLGDRDVQGPPRRLQPDGPASPARARRSGTRSSTSPRARLARCASTTTSTASPISRTAGSARTVKVDWPILVNLRLDPFERTGMYNGKDNGSIAYYNWFAYEFWRFVFVQQEVAQSGPDLHRVPADAEGRELQHGGGQGANREGHALAFRQLVLGRRMGARASCHPTFPRKGGRARAELNSTSAAARSGCRVWAPSSPADRSCGRPRPKPSRR